MEEALLRFSLQRVFGLVAFIAIAILIAVELWRSSPPTWETYSRDRLKLALEGGDIVLVSFYANWDPICLAHERQAINSISSYRTIRKNGVVTLRADYTNHSLHVAELMSDCGIRTVPGFAVFCPGSPDDPILLSDLPSEAQIMNAIQDAKRKGNR